MRLETNSLEYWEKKYPEKFASEDVIFSHIHGGNTIFMGSACAEPQYLVQGLIRYVESNPHAFFDAEIIHVRNSRRSPYTEKKFKQNFRHNFSLSAIQRGMPSTRGTPITRLSSCPSYHLCFTEASSMLIWPLFKRPCLTDMAI